MSAIRLHRTPKGVEIRVNDEDPVMDDPIWIQIVMPTNGGDVHAAVDLTIGEAEEIVRSLESAIRDAKLWREGDPT